MGDSTDKEPTLTENHVIIIACVCAVIIITLLIILVCFCIRRKRYIAKGSSQGTNQGDPPPYQAVPPNKKPTPHGYDNQDNNRMDGYPNRDMSPQGGVGMVGMSGPPPRSPTKDKYIDLQDRGGGGDMVDGGNKGGYHDDQTAGGKPKKVIYEVVV